jgi:hypothetical protein
MAYSSRMRKAPAQNTRHSAAIVRHSSLKHSPNRTAIAAISSSTEITTSSNSPWQ